jgi:hypothetical protein
MNDESSPERTLPEKTELPDRRLFLRSLGKWSGAAVIAAIAGAFGWLLRRRPRPASGLTGEGPGGAVAGSIAAAGGSIAAAAAGSIAGSK